MSDLQENISIILQVVDNTNNRLKKFSKEVEEVGTKSNRAAEGTDKASAGMNRVGISANKASAGMSKAGLSAEDAAIKTGKLADSTGKASLGFGSLIGKVTAFASALATIAYPVVEAATFERKMSEVKAITGATDEVMAKMSDTAKTLGRETEFSATAAAEGMKMLGMAGLTADQAITALPATLNLAQAGAIGLGESADFVTNIMGGMGLGVNDLSHIVDSLAVTATSSNSSVTELAQAMSYAAPAAKAAGVSLEETAGVMGILHNNGIKASRAGMGVKAMITKLLAPTKEAQTALDALGVSVSTNADGSLNLTKTLEDLSKANMGVAEAAKIFGLETMGVALAASAGTADIEKLTDANQHASDVMDGYNGAAEKMAATMNDNLVGSWRNLMSAVSGLAITLGEHLTPIIMLVVDGLTDLINGVTDLAEKYPQLTNVVMYAVGAFVVYKSTVAAAQVANLLFGGSLAGLIPKITSIASAITVLSSSFTKVKGLLTALMTPTTALGGALRMLGAIGAAAFVGWEIGGLLLNFDVVKKAGIALASGLTKSFLEIKKAWAWITGGDTAAIQKEIDEADKIYSEMFADVGKKAKDTAAEAGNTHKEITNKVKAETAVQVKAVDDATKKMGAAYDELNAKAGTGKKNEKQDEFGLTASERASVDEQTKKLSELNTGVKASAEEPKTGEAKQKVSTDGAARNVHPASYASRGVKKGVGRGNEGEDDRVAKEEAESNRGSQSNKEDKKSRSSRKASEKELAGANGVTDEQWAQLSQESKDKLKDKRLQDAEANKGKKKLDYFNSKNRFRGGAEEGVKDYFNSRTNRFRQDTPKSSGNSADALLALNSQKTEEFAKSKAEERRAKSTANSEAQSYAQGEARNKFTETIARNKSESRGNNLSSANNTIAKIGSTYANFTGDVGKTVNNLLNGIEKVSKTRVPTSSTALLKDSSIGSDPVTEKTKNVQQKGTGGAPSKVVELRLGGAALTGSDSSVESFIDQLEQAGLTA
jgi:TP901 family phage tail tape measure protein